MTEVVWKRSRVQYCHHIDQQVALQAETAFPADILPDQGGACWRIAVRTGWRATWTAGQAAFEAGTNPVIDPFIEK
jgi:hypothetical protein